MYIVCMYVRTYVRMYVCMYVHVSYIYIYTYITYLYLIDAYNPYGPMKWWLIPNGCRFNPKSSWLNPRFLPAKTVSPKTCC